MSTEKQRITLVRDYDASVDDVWDMWTTKEGIESWWGPEGFSVEVRKLELRPGGKLVYAMTAMGEPQRAVMVAQKMPITVETSITYTEIAAKKRLAYVNHADFIPGVAAYDVGTQMELEARGDMVRLTLTLDAMHDETWTGRMKAGWESELGKLGAALSVRKKG